MVWPFQNGIYTCRDDEGILFEENDDSDRLTDVEKIVNEFKHDADNLPEMKGKSDWLIYLDKSGYLLKPQW